jgi:hypothetical protein
MHLQKGKEKALTQLAADLNGVAVHSKEQQTAASATI